MSALLECCHHLILSFTWGDITFTDFVSDFKATIQHCFSCLEIFVHLLLGRFPLRPQKRVELFVFVHNIAVYFPTLFCSGVVSIFRTIFTSITCVVPSKNLVAGQHSLPGHYKCTVPAALEVKNTYRIVPFGPSCVLSASNTCTHYFKRDSKYFNYLT